MIECMYVRDNHIFIGNISPTSDIKNQNIKKWSDLEGFNCHKWEKNSTKRLIPIFGFQGEAINTEGLLKVLYFISGL